MKKKKKITTHTTASVKLLSLFTKLNKFNWYKFKFEEVRVANPAPGPSIIISNVELLRRAHNNNITIHRDCLELLFRTIIRED